MSNEDGNDYGQQYFDDKCPMRDAVVLFDIELGSLVAGILLHCCVERAANEDLSACVEYVGGVAEHVVHHRDVGHANDVASDAEGREEGKAE